MRERLDEYLDGLLAPEEAARVEEALRGDPDLRAELESARRFAELLEGLRPADAAAVHRAVAAAHRRHRRRALLRRLGGVLGAAAALLVAWILLRPEPPRPPDPLAAQVAEGWREFGRRLGAMAADRRRDRLPRIGLADLDEPPAGAMGVVFRSALGELGVTLADDLDRRVHDAVRDHFAAVRDLPEGIEGEYRRAEAELSFFRDLRSLAGRQVADAYYDVFRPGLADLATARRVPRGALLRVAPGESYLRVYEETLSRLRRWYGEEKVAVVLGRLAPGDRREYYRDAAQDGVGRDAVLSMRAHLYRAASESGAGALYVEVG